MLHFETINYMRFNSIEELDKYVKGFSSVGNAMNSIGKSRQYYYREKERLSHVTIDTVDKFVKWIKNHPKHIYHKFFVSRLVSHPKKPDRSTIEKVFAVLRDADKR